jgi:hypothetical protein
VGTTKGGRGGGKLSSEGWSSMGSNRGEEANLGWRGEIAHGKLEASQGGSEGGGFLPWASYQAAPCFGFPLGHGMREGGCLKRNNIGGENPHGKTMSEEGLHQSL